MRRIFFALFLLSVSPLVALAAEYSIQSKMLDKATDGAIEMGSVRLLAPGDSSLIVGTLSDQAGRFTLSKINTGKYILECRYLGYKTVYQNIEIKDKSLILPNIFMEEESKQLDEVQVTGMAAQMIVKVDTIEYNAAAFKTAENAVVEDLLKRLPGVQITDGSITVNGEKISRIKVDGKKFFDGDIEMTTKNLTADMIEKIQVVDEKSDMAKLTGFEDENTERIINLQLKPNRRRGVFGNVSAAGGADIDNGFNYDASTFLDDDFRYNANAFLNIMSANAQTAVVGGANNINSSFSGRGRGFRGWGGSNGITNTQNLGLNNNTQIKEGLLIGGDASYNHSTNHSETESSRDSWLSGDTISNNDKSVSNSNSDNANLRFEMEWKLDSLNTLIVQPSVSYSVNQTDRNQEYDYYNNGDSTSWGTSDNLSNSLNLNSRLNLIYSHKSSQKAGRSITMNLGGSYGESNSTGYNKSIKNTLDSIVNLDQMSLNTSGSYGMNMRASYVEPLWNLQNFIEAAVSFNYSGRDSEKEQFDNDGSGNYPVENKDLEYSNSFKNYNFTETAELNYRYVSEVWNIMAGFRAEPAQTFSYTTYGDGTGYDISQSVFNFSPSLSVRYVLGERRNFIRMEYRGRTQEPSVSQMQPVKNNSDLMNETVGNAHLVPSYNQNLRLIMSKYNPETFASWNATLFGDVTKDALVANSIYDVTGKQYNQTVNADRAPFNLNGRFMYNTPLIPNRLHFNTGTSVNYAERIGYSSRKLSDLVIDNLPLGARSLTKIYGFSEDLSLTFTHDIMEIGARGSFSYNNSLNNLNNTEQTTLNWSGSGNINLHLPNSINISTDISYSDRYGYANFDQTEVLWNATIDKTFKNKLTVSLTVNDILRQRLNVRQNYGDNNVSYSKYNTLPAYFLLSFSYRIQSFGGGSNNTQQQGMPQRMGRGMGGYGRGMGGSFPPGM
ncbi:MAG: outer membrane beta-barrel protein [Bacteroidales bacterium]|nr:outer membrane beta-barrel protein [Bacteroidales bacterium]MDD3431425.1 outer membrane beta-barrel protein [Bacteroidales bacterium]MDD4362486.1 outer membrane beta-barrel protein [Bacteroidales bacterium]